MSGAPKPTLAVYWAAGCGGCEVALLNTADRLPLLDRMFELVFCPCLMDAKLSDVAGRADGSIDLCLFNGAIRSSENLEMARLLRRTSKLLVAYGSCAHEGCAPGLANLDTTAALLDAVYLDNPSTDNPDAILPQQESRVSEGTLQLPALNDTVATLQQVVPVDYVIPGCPPEPQQVWASLELIVEALLGGAELPATGTVLGAGGVALCEECPLERRRTALKAFRRPHEVVPEPGLCLLDQGLVCMGVATRLGCGALCPRAGMGCRGCYGPPPECLDSGAAMVSALSAKVEVSLGLEAETAEQDLAREVEEIMATVVDPAGTFYRFSLAGSLLRRARPPITGESEPEPEP